jgi:hypothetical protein
VIKRILPSQVNRVPVLAALDTDEKELRVAVCHNFYKEHFVLDLPDNEGFKQRFFLNTIHVTEPFMIWKGELFVETRILFIE